MPIIRATPARPGSFGIVDLERESFSPSDDEWNVTRDIDGAWILAEQSFEGEAFNFEFSHDPSVNMDQVLFLELPDLPEGWGFKTDNYIVNETKGSITFKMSPSSNIKTATLTIKNHEQNKFAFYSGSLQIPIPSDGTVVNSELEVSGVSEEVADVNVKLNIQQKYNNTKTDAYLVAPDGTKVKLFENLSGQKKNLTLDDESYFSLPNKPALLDVSGSYRPEGELWQFDSIDPNGTWSLEVTDETGQNLLPGLLKSWSLDFNIRSNDIQPITQQPQIYSTSAAPEISQANPLTYNAAEIPLEIPELDTVNSELLVSNFEGSLNDVNVELDITHTYNSDLDVFLLSPVGTKVELFTDVGSNQDNFTNTVLDDEANQLISSGAAPFSGSFIPEGQLSDFDGQDPNGNWSLEITDQVGQNVTAGTLNSWSLILS
ncbi:proprotein convertase P-domain-containing protein [Lyngbya aestuarii]|uniref:proprotein convertase P-domain-containing protein n=1 Tax=Lyngbya aestuarii TaxID=118322 RepID=UPI00403DD56E